ncbi:tissue factor-like [Plectropomus leopardus]|uniref:tissue factor-like n=1 Tax=Plectropomus leopardus TaxID=160734 RepID=UPI001C4B8DC7|nr:tissue factor-like [Plectropomus leopardus]
MASVKTVLYLGVCLFAAIITTADSDLLPKAQNVRWVSLDFKTILHWTVEPSKYKYTVLYSRNGSDWMEILECTRLSQSECDLSIHLTPYNKFFTADIKTEPESLDYDYDLEEFPHTESPPFNPYKDSNISAVNFTVEAADESRAIVNIIDPLTSIHQGKKQLSIRDIFKKDLKYKIIYYKAGSTGKREVISDTSTTEVTKLDAGQSYCFMVAAFIPNRRKATQQGAWSIQQCTPGEINILQDLSLGAWVGIVFILLTVLIIIITVTVLCCKCCRQKNPSQQSATI